MLYIYVLLSIAFSCVGALFYGIFLRRAGLMERKWSLVAIAVASLILPFLVPSLPHFSEGLRRESTFDYHEYKAWNVVDITDPSLLSCYEKAKASREVCQCEIEQKSKLIVYAPNAYYDAALVAEQGLNYAFLLGLGLFGGLAILQFFALWQFARRQPYRDINFENRSLRLLLPSQKLPVAAFGFWRDYVIWGQQLEALSEADQRAILLHEAEHLRQKDSWLLLFWQLLRGIWYLNPAFYFLRREWRRLSELVADQPASQSYPNPKSYARLLLALKTQQNALPLAAQFSRNPARSLLFQRIQAACNPPRPPRAMPYFTWLALAAALWFTGSHLRPALQAQHIALHQYQLLQQQNQLTGIYFFCPDCLKTQ